MRIFRLTNLSATIFMWFCFTAVSCYAQDAGLVISSPEHQKTLNDFKRQADDFRSRNLNRFGLFVLQKYDLALDSIFANEKADTLAAIVENSNEKVAVQRAESIALKTQLDELNSNKEINTGLYHGLLRKAGIAFVVWLAVILILLAWRKRLVKKSQLELDANIAQLKTSEHFYAEGVELFRLTTDFLKKINEMDPFVSEIQKSTDTLSKKLAPELLKSDSFQVLQKNSAAIQTSTNRFHNLTNAIVEQNDEPGQEKKPVNINVLCDHYTDLAYTGMVNADGTFACQLSKDFEKNLPMAKIFPEPVGSLLLNVLGNAFQGVNEKMKKEIKGYVPKVSISTRILPRFIQIRVKDNSDGIPDSLLEEIYEPFYSTRPTGEGAGLGLSFSRQIIKENNGEIKIESEVGNGTDVYIKFFLHS